MNPTELKELARTFEGIADGKPWQFTPGVSGPWIDAVENRKDDPVDKISRGLVIRLKPWELGRSINGHTLPEWAEWHRQDFTEDMLPAGTRPLMSGEFIHADDEFDYDQTGRFMAYKDWKDDAAPYCIGVPVLIGVYHHRTTRPVPAPEPQWVPLGPEDVPPGSVLRGPGQVAGQQPRIVRLRLERQRCREISWKCKGHARESVCERACRITGILVRFGIEQYPDNRSVDGVQPNSEECKKPSNV